MPPEAQPAATEVNVPLVTVMNPVTTIGATSVAVPPVAAAATMSVTDSAISVQRQKQDYGPQKNWSRSLKPMTAHRVSVENTYLFQNVKFTSFQEEHFWKAVQDARTFNGGVQANAEQLPDMVVKFWNEKHYQRIGEGFSVGLGGLIRRDHVKMLLRKKGNEIRAAQSGGNNPHPQPIAAMGRKLKRGDISSVSFREAGPWLTKIGKSLHSTLPKRKEELMKHFDGKPDDCELSL